MSGERPRTHGEHGERLADWRSQTPEDERPQRRPLDPDDPRIPQLGRIAITEPRRAALDAERARKLGEIATRESVQQDRAARADREAPPEREAREDTPTRPEER